MDRLPGKTALVTGGTAGIGFHTAVGLARCGAHVVVTARDAGRGEEAVSEIQRQAGHEHVRLLVADASSVHASLALADQISRHTTRLDILVNNAGRTFGDRRETAEGLEATLALNFAGPFALTTRLLPLLARSEGARIVNVVSSAFRMWKGDPFDDLHATRRYVGIEAHARAKLLNLLFTLALARRLAGSSAVANAVNPGMAWTPGTASLTPETVPHWRFVWPIVRWFQRRASAETAARAPIHLAVSPDLARVSGRYFDGLNEKRVPRRFLDAALQQRTWELGEQLVEHVVSAATPRTERLSTSDQRGSRGQH
jgi:NAD(P)-dependent dehydrogenase (short-subunit alcohol dehydrogenase family)